MDFAIFTKFTCLNCQFVYVWTFKSGDESGSLLAWCSHRSIDILWKFYWIGFPLRHVLFTSLSKKMLHKNKSALYSLFLLLMEVSMPQFVPHLVFDLVREKTQDFWKEEMINHKLMHFLEKWRVMSFWRIRFYSAKIHEKLL